MAVARVLSGGAAMASMTAHLISKLSLRQEDEPVDLGNLKSPRTGFVAIRFYLVGKLNSARAVQFDSFRSDVQAMWRLSVSVEVQQCGDRFLFTFNNQRDLDRVKKGDPWSYQSAILLNDYDGFSDIMVVLHDFFWIWVEICDLPTTFTTEVTLRLVVETIRLVLNVDQAGLRRGSTRVRVTLPLNSLVRKDRRLRVSPEDVIRVQYRYERFVGLCRDCMMLNHGGIPCPNAQDAEEGTGALLGPAAAPEAPPIVFRANTQAALVVPNFSALFRKNRSVQIREVAPFPSPAKEDEIESRKRLKHSLAMVSLDLNLEDLGFSMAVSGELGIKKTGKSLKKRGRPRGSKNKK
ncbi:hypothetical protein ACLB2K_075223 [Fragaria x ananassa]